MASEIVVVEKVARGHLKSSSKVISKYKGDLTKHFDQVCVRQCTILRRVRVADRGFRSAGHADISPLRGRRPRWFFSGKIS